MKTIIVADALMGIDNVLGVAGAANGSFDLVVLGLLISIPIVVMGSKLVLRLVERWPLIIHVGAAVLAFTAAQMIVNEKLLTAIFSTGESIDLMARIATYVIAISGVLGLGWWTSKQAPQNDAETQSV
jgi:predicted tellurium resistance membrane protein TerC